MTQNIEAPVKGNQNTQLLQVAELKCHNVAN